MKKILHLLLGFGFSAVLMFTCEAAPTALTWQEPQLGPTVEQLEMAMVTISAPDLDLEVPAQSPAIRLALQMGNYTDASKAFKGVPQTRFARSATSYDFRRRWYQHANWVSSSYYNPRPLQTEPDPGRFLPLFMVWPQG